MRADKNQSHVALLDITSTAGNWQQFDPNDPPRLIGTIQPTGPNADATAGPFDAAYCSTFVSQVIVE